MKYTYTLSMIGDNGQEFTLSNYGTLEAAIEAAKWVLRSGPGVLRITHMAEVATVSREADDGEVQVEMN